MLRWVGGDGQGAHPWGQGLVAERMGGLLHLLQLLLLLQVKVMVGGGVRSGPGLLGAGPRQEAEAERGQAGRVAVTRVGPLKLLLKGGCLPLVT